MMLIFSLQRYGFFPDFRASEGFVRCKEKVSPHPRRIGAEWGEAKKESLRKTGRYLTLSRCPSLKVLLRSMPLSWQIRAMVVP